MRIYDTKERQQYIEKSVDLVFAKAGLLPHQPLSRQKNSEEQEEEAQDYQLATLEEAGINYHDGWIPVLDITSEYNKYLLSLWSNSPNPTDFTFDIYNRRLYELVIVDFRWLPNFQEEESDGRLSFLLTFHANGDLVTWWISVSENNNLQAEVASRISLGTHCITCKHAFIKVSSTSGILAVAFNSGQVKLFRVQSSLTEQGRPQVSTEAGEIIWEADELQTEFMEFVSSLEDVAVGKTPSVTLVMVKHPHFVISFRLEICPDRIVAQEMNTRESPHGTIVGLSHYSPGLLLAMHENGKFAWVIVKGHEVEINLDVGDVVEPEVVEAEESDYTDSHKIHSQDLEYMELWAFCGFALSPNGTLGLSTKTLKRAADTILIKECSACTFFSIFPAEEDAWQHVKSKYEQGGCYIQRIPDVLQGFRHLLRLNGEYDFGKYFHAGRLVDMNIAELKLFIWVLRAMGLPTMERGGKPSLPMDVAEAVSVSILRNVTLAQEHLIEKHHVELIHSVFQHGRLLTDNLESSSLNMKSAFAILEYLRSKPHIQVPKEFQVPIQIRPICSTCDREIGYEYNRSYDPRTGITAPGIVGYKWNGQTCEAQHFNPVCVLSLVPFENPHRLCPYCGCAALMEPAFSQASICPFCEEFMCSEPERNVAEIVED